MVQVPVWHVPQLFMHMLCMGPGCQSALFVSCSATRGCTIFRVKRDEVLIAEIIRFLALFNGSYGHGRTGVGPEFFWNARGYRAMLQVREFPDPQGLPLGCAG